MGEEELFLTNRERPNRMWDVFRNALLETILDNWSAS